jgi:hypothetical protein
MESERWTDEELIQVYDLQERYTEKIVDFVRNGAEKDVYDFLQVVPELNNYYLYDLRDKDIFRRTEFMEKHGGEEIPHGRYIYKDFFDKWQGADTLREVFEAKYQWDFAEARPETLALFADNKEVALETYSAERYEKLHERIPQKLQNEIRNFILNYPADIQEKAFRKAIYGYTNGISSGALLRYRNEHMPEFEKVQWLIQQESTDTIVAAYDLQAGLKIYHPKLENIYMTSAIREFVCDENIFRIVYGDKAAELMRQADEKTIELARKYDFVSSEEKIEVVENHKVCLFGTVEQKLRIPYRNDPFCVSEKDLQIILDEVASKLEREGFADKYHPSKSGIEEYYNQPYKVVGRAKAGTELEPQWNIMFEDGKIITARADEIISSAINERLYGKQFEEFGARPLSEAQMSFDNENLSLSEGKERITAIIRQLRSNGEHSEDIKDFLEEERRNLSNANVR